MICLHVGNLFISALAIKTFSAAEIYTSLVRHSKENWGDLPEDNGLMSRGRILSKYQFKDKREVYVVTDEDLNITSIHLPEEHIDC